MIFKKILFCIIISVLISCSGNKERESSIEEAISETMSSQSEKKVLLINSYHKGYFWTDGITQAIIETFDSESSRQNITLEIIYMDTKRNQSEEYIIDSALDIKSFIESWSPDLVITTDDNAAAYVIVPYFKDTSIPFVFCGVNWDAGEYGFPASNVTGMVEVQLIDQIIKTLSEYTDGERIAFLKGDDFSTRKEAAFFEERFNIKLIKKFVKNFDEWQIQYKQLQNEADILLIGNPVSIADWDRDKALDLVNEVTKIPSGNWDESMKEYNLVTFATKAEEQGEWAAETALKILSGIDPKDIAIVKNEKAKIFLNMELAKKMDIVFPIDLINQAFFVE